MTTEELLIEQLVEALSPCSELLNAMDQIRDAVLCNQLNAKSELCIKVDQAIEAWRVWKFN